MQLTRFTDYSLRVLIYLCSQPPEEKVALEYLAEHFNINRHHLQKVSQRLSQLGWIDSARGKNGGIRIDPKALTLSLATIVQALETEVKPIRCDLADCPIVGSCKLQGVLNRAGRAFMDVLASYQLQDLRQSDLRAIRSLLGEAS
jgi:Rrf2 family nitric oxide-sensitive transcriptional repressor